MTPISLLLLLPAVFALPSHPSVITVPSDIPTNEECTANGVQIFAARGSLEDVGAGMIGAVARQVAAHLPGSNIVAIDYPATIAHYVMSESKGVAEVTKLVTDYSERCPDSKIVLMGYSQGAQITSSALCGPSPGFPQPDALHPNITSKIIACVLMGDPTRHPDDPFNRGTAKNEGIMPRNTTRACLSMEPNMVSYCNEGDWACDSGRDMAVHMEYVKLYGDAAVQFVLGKAKNMNMTVGGMGMDMGHGKGTGMEMRA